MDFGGLKEFKTWLDYMFDHTVVVAEDDPQLYKFKDLQEVGGILDLRIVSGVGCERFSELAYNKLMEILTIQKESGILLNNTVTVKSVEIFEHGANSAIYEG